MPSAAVIEARAASHVWVSAVREARADVELEKNWIKKGDEEDTF